MENIKKHYPEITALKGIAIFFVVLGHAIVRFPINLHAEPVCKFLFDFVSSVHMPLFFIVSGFCFSYKEKYVSYIKKKIKRLVVPYIVFNILDMIPRFVLPQLVNRPKSISESILDMLIRGGEYWFLYTLFMIFLIYPLLYKLQSKSLILKVVCAIFLLVLSIVKINTSLFKLNELSYYLVYFHLGVMIKNSNIKIFDLKRNILYIFIPAVLAALWIWILLSPFAKTLRMPLALIGVIVCYFLSRSKWVVSVFERFGTYSLQLYLLNGFLLVISRTIICKLTNSPIIIVIFNMVITFLFSYMVIKYVVCRVKIFRKIMGMV